MRVLRFWGLVPAFCLLALPAFAAESVNKLEVGTAEKKIGSTFTVPLTLTTTDNVQGLVAVVEVATAGAGQITGLVVDAALDAAADTVVTRVGDAGEFALLGVVLDTNGDGPSSIGPGTDIPLAALTIECAGVEGGSDLVFVDNKYAAAPGGPVLENIVVVGGLSIGELDGLDLANGGFACYGVRNQFTIDSANATSSTGTARVLMDNLGDVQGYVVALCQDPADLTLNSIAVGQAATGNGADFVVDEVFPNGGTLAVVMDLEFPYEGNVIPAGEAHHIATYRYTCVGQLPPPPGKQVPLQFCDNVLGSPPKENVIVIDGLSVSPFVEDGTFTCVTGPVCVPTEPGRELTCNDGRDNDCDGRIDCADPDCASAPPCIVIPAEQSFLCGSKAQGPTGAPGQVTGSIGAEEEVCFYIQNPEDDAVGSIPQYDHIQGFSMAVTYCCDIMALPGFDTSGTILEAINAEYVNLGVDNDPDDGDGCELIIGVLVDALPPFDGATIPPTDRVQRMGCVTFAVRDGAVCGEPCPIEFTDDINGPGKVPIRNLISVENISRPPVLMVDCSIMIVNEERFFRGDCNFSGDSSQDGRYAVDIADAATVISYLFAPPLYKPQIQCLDACDCNDDGRIDLADAVCILRYLFTGGPEGKFPPAPGPGLEETGQPNPNNVRGTPAGPDPTLDLLDCAAGGSC